MHGIIPLRVADRGEQGPPMEYTDRMREARGTRGYEDVAASMRAYLAPAQWVTGSTVRRTELGAEEKADPVRLWAMSQVYEVPLEQLSPIAARWFEGVTGPPQAPGGTTDQGTVASSWIDTLAA